MTFLPAQRTLSAFPHTQISYKHPDEAQSSPPNIISRRKGEI